MIGELEEELIRRGILVKYHEETEQPVDTKAKAILVRIDFRLTAFRTALTDQEEAWRDSASESDAQILDLSREKGELVVKVEELVAVNAVLEARELPSQLMRLLKRKCERVEELEAALPRLKHLQSMDDMTSEAVEDYELLDKVMARVQKLSSVTFITQLSLSLLQRM